MYIALTQDERNHIRQGIYVFEKIQKDVFVNAYYYIPFKGKIYKRYYDKVYLRPQTIAIIYDLDKHRVVWHTANVDVDKLIKIAINRLKKFIKAK